MKRTISIDLGPNTGKLKKSKKSKKFKNKYLKQIKLSIKKYKTKAILIILGCLFILLFPIALDHIILGNRVASNLSAGEWASFLGSYSGALIGAFVTLWGIIATIRHTKAQANEDRRLSLAPYLKYTWDERDKHKQLIANRKHDMYILHSVDDIEKENTQANGTILIKNIGMGPVVDFRVYEIMYMDKKLNQSIFSENDILEKDCEWSLLIDLRLYLDEIKPEDMLRVKDMTEGEGVYKTVPPFYKNSGDLTFRIKYKDLLGYSYYQNLCVNLSVVTSCSNGINWKYNYNGLVLKKAGELVVERTSRNYKSTKEQRKIKQ